MRPAVVDGQDGRVDLPVMPPVKPMLAKPVPAIPTGQLYEPKWDGFRSIIFRDGDEVEIGSRNERPMTRYFPEVVDAVLANFPERAVIDGEIIVLDRERNTLDFEALQQRIHPAASRVKLLAEQTPASFVAFDLLALGDEDLTEPPVRRAARPAGAGAGAARSRRSTSPRPPTTTSWRRTLVRAVRGRRAGRADRQEAGPDLPARQAGDEQDQARADLRLRGRRVPGAQVRAGRHRLAAAGAVRRARRAGLGRGDRGVPDGPAQGAVRRDAAAGHRRSTATRGTGRRTSRASGRRARTRPAGGTPARTCRSSRCARSGWSRFATTTWRAYGSGTPRSSSAGARTGSPESCTYEQLERPVRFDLAEVLGLS